MRECPRGAVPDPPGFLAWGARQMFRMGGKRPRIPVHLYHEGQEGSKGTPSIYHTLSRVKSGRGAA
jgi:hypothetical protein